MVCVEDPGTTNNAAAEREHLKTGVCEACWDLRQGTVISVKKPTNPPQKHQPFMLMVVRPWDFEWPGDTQSTSSCLPFALVWGLGAPSWACRWCSFLLQGLAATNSP